LVRFWRNNAFKAIHVVGYLDTVGIKSNGTLWISSEAKPKVWTGGEMMQFGDETKLAAVARWYREGLEISCS